MTLTFPQHSKQSACAGMFSMEQPENEQLENPQMNHIYRYCIVSAVGDSLMRCISCACSHGDSTWRVTPSGCLLSQILSSIGNSGCQFLDFQNVVLIDQGVCVCVLRVCVCVLLSLWLLAVPWHVPFSSENSSAPQGCISFSYTCGQDLRERKEKNPRERRGMKTNN